MEYLGLSAVQDTLTALCIVEGGGEALWEKKNGEGNGRL